MHPSQAFLRVQEHCMSKPGAVEEYPWGVTVWKVGKKVFAIGDQDSARFTVKATLDEQAALIQLPHIDIASHVGRYGWVTIEAHAEGALEQTLDLVDRSFDRVCAKKGRAIRT